MTQIIWYLDAIYLTQTILDPSQLSLNIVAAKGYAMTSRIVEQYNSETEVRDWKTEAKNLALNLRHSAATRAHHELGDPADPRRENTTEWKAADLLEWLVKEYS